jgi:hypothetical protein
MRVSGETHAVSISCDFLAPSDGRNGHFLADLMHMNPISNYRFLHSFIFIFPS